MVADRGQAAGWQGAFLQPAFSPPPFIAGSQNKRPSQMKNSHPADERLCTLQMNNLTLFILGNDPINDQ